MLEKTILFACCMVAATAKTVGDIDFKSLGKIPIHAPIFKKAEQWNDSSSKSDPFLLTSSGQSGSVFT